jgi:oligopeptide/dipeptide ABC transporter ATP-binding protein
MTAPHLSVEKLEVRLRSRGRDAPVLEDVDIAVDRRETLAVVGESGCGKSMLALAIMGLMPPVARVAKGRISLDGTELTALDERRLQQVRGKAVSMVFQEPMTALNPVLSVGHQIAEVVQRHERVSRHAAMERAVEMLDLVRLPEPRRRAADYPHRLSGGMRQRVVIAIALACRPGLLLADEPTTALDVTIQAEILGLIRSLQDELGMALVLITHDLGVVAETADRVAVMYAGRKIEEAPVEALFRRPLHPYTVGLLGAIAQPADAGTRRRLVEIRGSVPPLGSPRVGCLFAPRCPLADDHCRSASPPLVEHEPGHRAACWKAGQAHV